MSALKSEMKKDDTVLGNVYDKYTTTNPVARYLFNGFLQGFRELLEGITARNALEVGCGEGYLAAKIVSWKPELRIWGIDLSEELFETEISSDQRIAFSAQSAYSLGFPDRAFDLVIGAEVLEHLERPEQALEEVERVACGHVLLSVPREPIWRAMNIARLSYLREFGNTPGHLQHWSSRSFVSLVSRYLEVVRVVKPLPWTMILARKKSRGIASPNYQSTTEPSSRS